MNLIELSEQLKDVPDQYLLKEVQSPSGTYPAYLVVTELTRRKRMREQAAQEAPKSTVVEDLTRPAAPQGGLMSTPYASEELAAQDAMGAQPPVQMAGGGIVAFQGGGLAYDVDFENLPKFEAEPLGQIGSMGEAISRPFQLIGRSLSNGDLRVDPVTKGPITRGEFLRRQAAEKEKAAITRQKEILAEVKKRPSEVAPTPEALSSGSAPARAPATRSVDRPVATRAEVVSKSPASVYPKSDKKQDATTSRASRINLTSPADESLEGIKSLSVPPERELQTQGQLGQSAYKGAVPFRYGFIDKEIAARQAELPSLRASNINDALMRAGLGIMGSRSPRFLQAVAEGGTAGLDSYRQGLKDIREGEKEIMAARASLANAQALYDQGMFNAGNQEKQNAMERFRLGADLMRTKDAAIVHREEIAIREQQLRQNAAIAAMRNQSDFALLPYQRELLQAQAESARAQAAASRQRGSITDADQKAAEEEARNAVLSSGKDPSTPEGRSIFNEVYAEAIRRREAGAGYQPPPQPKPPVRNPSAPLK